MLVLSVTNYMCCIRMLYLLVPTGNMLSALLLIGLGGMELQPLSSFMLSEMA